VEGKPYFSKDWVKGSVKTIMNEEFSNKLLFMYDKVGGRLFFKNEDSAMVMEADGGMIYSFTLINRQAACFYVGLIFLTTIIKGNFLKLWFSTTKNTHF
jgi:hypothetical protein